MSKRLRLTCTVIIERDEGSFHAYCPGLKGLHVDGKTEKDALDNAIEAAKVYIESVVRYGDPLPVDPDFFADHVELSPVQNLWS